MLAAAGERPGNPTVAVARLAGSRARPRE
jgi:hypothetical protein